MCMSVYVAYIVQSEYVKPMLTSFVDAMYRTFKTTCFIVDTHICDHPSNSSSDATMPVKRDM